MVAGGFGDFVAVEQARGGVGDEFIPAVAVGAGEISDPVTSGTGEEGAVGAARRRGQGNGQAEILGE